MRGWTPQQRALSTGQQAAQPTQQPVVTPIRSPVQNYGPPAPVKPPGGGYNLNPYA
jgi:hypothetical protein